VYAAPRVDRVEVARTRGMKRAEILAATRVGEGQTFYAELDAAPAEDRVEALFAREGWPDAHASVVELVAPDGALTVFVQVEAGEPRIAGPVRFVGDEPVPARRLRRWARGAGVKEGRPLSPVHLADAAYEIRSRLGRLRTFPNARDGGWLEARVTPAPPAADGVTATFTVEAGRQLRLESYGVGRADVVEALGLDARTRLTRAFVRTAPEQVEDWLGRRGVPGCPSGRHPRRHRTDAGSRGSREERRAPPRLDDVVFVGNAAIPDRTLKALVLQESDEVLRLGRVTEEEARATAPALVELYRARGHLDAAVTFDGLDVAARRGFGTLVRRLRGAQPVHDVVVRFSVDEGPLTTLSSLELVGVAPEVDRTAADAVAADVVGEPLSPQRLGALAQALVEAHRAAGYLEADARVNVAPVAVGGREVGVDRRSTWAPGVAAVGGHPGQRAHAGGAGAAGGRAAPRRAGDVDRARPAPAVLVRPRRVPRGAGRSAR
jgi:hypothetical protein